MFVGQPVVLGVLVFKVGVTLLALLCSEVLKVFLAFFCITKLVLKINTRTILTTIDRPKEKTTFKKDFWLSSSSWSLQTQCLRAESQSFWAASTKWMNSDFLISIPFQKHHSLPACVGGRPKTQLKAAFQTVYFKCMVKVYKKNTKDKNGLRKLMLTFSIALNR